MIIETKLNHKNYKEDILYNVQCMVHCKIQQTRKIFFLSQIYWDICFELLLINKNNIFFIWFLINKDISIFF